MLNVRKSQKFRHCYCCGKEIEPKQARFITNLENTSKDINICWQCVEKILTKELK